MLDATLVNIMNGIIAKAKKADINLTPGDFQIINGDELIIDGMDADEWLDAMTDDECE